MNRPEALRRRGTGCWPLGVGGLVVVCLLSLVFAAPVPLIVSPVPASAQAPGADALARAEATYASALQVYLEVLGVRDQEQFELEVLVDRQLDARGSGDDERLSEAIARVHTQGIRLMLLEGELASAAEALEAAGRQLLRLLDAREEELLAQLERAVLPTTRNRLEGEIAELRIRVRQVEAQVGPDLVTTVRPLPELTVRPTDGRQQLVLKASIMEDWAHAYQVQLAALDQEIGVRERRIQQERGREDFLTGLSRFDDDRLTGGGITGTLPERREPSTDGALLLADLPLTEQVALLRQLRDRIEELHVEALARARVFRQRAEGGPG